MGRIQWWALVVGLCCVTGTVRGAISFSVTFDDPTNTFGAPVRSLVTSHVVAAGDRWAGYLSGNAAIEVVVKSTTSVPYAEGRSVTNNFVRNNGTFNVFEQGMTAEIRTGVDPNGAAPDVEIDVNPDYVNNELWFDPNPAARTAVVDIDHTDAMSTFIHEFGHALGFAGWINPTTGTYPGDYQSTFDEHTTFDGTNFYFTGADAVAVHGTPPPLTFGNVFHVANFSPQPGEDLLHDVMNGLNFYRGSRYDISPIDLAMLRGMGVPIIYKAGDYNANGVVDAADYVVWRKGIAWTYVQNDYNVWRARLGQTGGSGGAASASSPVPEPTTVALLLWGVVMGSSRRRERRVGLSPGQ